MIREEEEKYWGCGAVSRKDKIRNDNIRQTLGVKEKFTDKIMQTESTEIA